MPTTRTMPQSYYYSGQGRLLIGDRDENGNGYNFVHVGNVTALSAEIAIEKFEHKESMSGARAIDKTIIKEKKATVKFTCESLSLENLALGLFGESTTVAGSTVADEAHKFTAGGAIALKYANVSAVTVQTGAELGAATTVDASNYTVDAEFGTIHPVDNGAFTGDNVYVSYTYGTAKKLDVFTKSFPDEKFLRFEGLNTVNDDLVLINMPRVTIDPLPGLQLINEELANVEFTGNVLLDPTISSGSQFMTQQIITPA